MKVSDLKVVKGLKTVVNKYFVLDDSGMSISTRQVIKGSKDIEKGTFDVGINVREDGIPEEMDGPEFVSTLKKAIADDLKVNVRYLEFSWGYSDRVESSTVLGGLSTSNKSNVSVSFQVKLDM